MQPIIKSPSAVANNNTRLASGVVRRKNKLEGVVQKKNCPYYIDYQWLVKEKDSLCHFTLTQGLGPHNLYQESKRIIMPGSRAHFDTRPPRNRIIPGVILRRSTHMDPRCAGKCTRLIIPSHHASRMRRPVPSVGHRTWKYPIPILGVRSYSWSYSRLQAPICIPAKKEINTYLNKRVSSILENKYSSHSLVIG